MRKKLEFNFLNPFLYRKKKARRTQNLHIFIDATKLQKNITQFYIIWVRDLFYG